MRSSNSNNTLQTSNMETMMDNNYHFFKDNPAKRPVLESGTYLHCELQGHVLASGTRVVHGMGKEFFMMTDNITLDRKRARMRNMYAKKVETSSTKGRS